MWSAPGRVNLIGEHTDYNDGFVLPFAIDLYVHVAAARRDDGRIVCTSEQAPHENGDELVATLDPAAPAHGWLAYPYGVVWSLASHGDVGGLDLLIDGEIPLGSGLASSAALECAVACAAAELYGLDLTPVDLALVGTRAENEYVGVPTGAMDQLAAMLCIAEHALFLDARTLVTDHIRLDPAADACTLVVIDTGVRHTLAASAYGDRRRSCEEAARRLGVPTLREVDLPRLGDLDDTVLFRRARHVVTENARVADVVRLLRQGRLRDVGPVLSSSHASLRDDFDVSSTELDAVADAAVNGGALGARMIGGGFGGSVLVLAEPGSEENVHSSVSAALVDRGLAPPELRRVAPGPGARRQRDY